MGAWATQQLKWRIKRSEEGNKQNTNYNQETKMAPIEKGRQQPKPNKTSPLKARRGS
jgi:hypothetical protein